MTHILLLAGLSWILFHDLMRRKRSAEPLISLYVFQNAMLKDIADYIGL